MFVDSFIVRYKQLIEVRKFIERVLEKEYNTCDQVLLVGDLIALCDQRILQSDFEWQKCGLFGV